MDRTVQDTVVRLHRAMIIAGGPCRAATISLVLAAVLIGFKAPASGETPGAALTLNACVSMAVERNLALIQATLRKEASGALSRVALKDMFPRISTGYGYTGQRDASTIKLPGSNGTGSTRINSRDNYAWDVNVTQPIFQGGVLWNTYQSARIDLDISEMQMVQVENDLVRQVKEAYYGVLKATQGRKEARAAVERVESLVRDARGFFNVGLIARNELLQSEVELAQAQQALITAANDVELARAQLNLLLRQDLNAHLELADSLEFAPYTKDPNALLARAKEARPEIRAGVMAVEKARREQRIAQGGYWPRVDLTATYQKRGITPDVSDNPFGDHDAAQIMIQASWELWAWGQTRDAVMARSYDLSRAEAALSEVKDSVALEVKEAWLRLQETEQQVAVAESSLAQAEENYRLNQARYKEQLATATEVLDAQALLTRARTSYFNAKADHLIARARMEYFTGGVE